MDFAQISTNDYYPYGMVMSSTNGGTTNPDAEKYGYQSKERDIESGYDYFEARLYDSATGRFLQVDPLVEKFRAMNSYMGMGSNPLRIIDPDGKEIYIVTYTISYDEETGEKTKTETSRVLNRRNMSLSKISNQAVKQTIKDIDKLLDILETG